MAGQPYLTVTVDREKLARYGVNASDVLHVIELGVAGMPVGQVYQDNRVFDIAIRFPEEHRQSAGEPSARCSSTCRAATASRCASSRT